MKRTDDDKESIIGDGSITLRDLFQAESTPYA